MKKYLKYIVISILTIESKLVLWKFKPKIITVVGSVGKTSSKDAIYTALKDSLYIRKNQKSFGSEIGVPLTILGLSNAWNDYTHWAINIIRGLFVPFSFRYPKVLVLEIGIDKPKDMEKIGKWIKPNIVVITHLPDVPVHVENFDSPEDLILEKKKILDYVAFDGAIVVNADDAKVLKAAQNKRSDVKQLITYGFSEDADVQLSNQHIIYKNIEGQNIPIGMSLKVNHAGNSVPLALHGVIGLQHAYPVASAIAVGIANGVSIISMMQSLQYHRPPRGRMNIIEGINKTVIIDDSYNASPEAMTKAVEVLSSIETSGAKITVLGDMMEIGKFTAREHKRIGRLVAENGISYLFTVGVRSKDIAHEALEAGMLEDKIFHFDKSEDVAEELKKFMNPGATILVKGSQGMRMEKVVEKVMLYPEQSKDFLIRQNKEWKGR